MYESYIGLFEINRGQGRDNDSINILKRSMTYFRNQPRIPYILGDTLRDLDRKDEAIHYYKLARSIKKRK